MNVGTRGNSKVGRGTQRAVKLRCTQGEKGEDETTCAVQRQGLGQPTVTAAEVEGGGEATRAMVRGAEQQETGRSGLGRLQHPHTAKSSREHS
jgi:hypothetical protein